jgi:hypothetical protein
MQSSITPVTPSSALSPRVAALYKKIQSSRGRLVFALDATASREETWDLATQLQASMFEEAAKIGSLDVQLVYYRGTNEVRASAWTSNPHALVGWMNKITCAAGATKIARILQHIRTENAREKVAAAIFVGDACEELPSDLYDAAAGLTVPAFLFQEGDASATLPLAFDRPPLKVEQVFRELARLTNGAWARFDANAASKLGELLRAVAAFAIGGTQALANQQTDSARKLLGQMK